MNKKNVCILAADWSASATPIVLILGIIKGLKEFNTSRVDFLHVFSQEASQNSGLKSFLSSCSATPGAEV